MIGPVRFANKIEWLAKWPAGGYNYYGIKVGLYLLGLMKSGAEKKPD